jgi:hypothetical protein
MACTSLKRFNSFIKELGEEASKLTPEQIIDIKEKITGNFQPHLHEDIFPSDYDYSPVELGINDLFPKLNDKQKQRKITMFKNSLKKLRKGEKLGSQQAKLYNQISKWIDENKEISTEIKKENKSKDNNSIKNNKNKKNKNNESKNNKVINVNNKIGKKITVKLPMSDNYTFSENSTPKDLEINAIYDLVINGLDEFGEILSTPDPATKELYNGEEMYESIEDSLDKIGHSNIFKDVHTNEEISELDRIAKLIMDRAHEGSYALMNRAINKAYEAIEKAGITVNRGIKGSMSRTDNVILEEKLIERVLDDTNVADTFMEVIKQIDLANGKKPLVTKAYSDHVGFVFDRIKNILKNTGARVELTLGTTLDPVSRGIYREGYDYSKDLDRDSITILFNPEDKTATASELLLHELMHSTMKRYLDSRPSIREQFKLLRKTLKNKIDKSIFLEQAINEGATELTEDMKKSIEEKWDYIMSEDSDIEEFMAYIISNSYLYNAVKDIKVEKEFKNRLSKIFNSMKDMKYIDNNVKKMFALAKNIIDLFLAIPLTIFDIVSDMVSGRNKAIGKTGQQLIENTLKDIESFQLRMEHLKDNGLATFLHDYSDTIQTPFLAGSIETAANFIDVINKIGIKLDPVAQVALHKLFEIKDKAIDKLSDKDGILYNAYNGIIATELGSRLLKARLTRSLIYQNFSVKKYEKIEELHRKKKQAFDALMTNINSVFKDKILNSTLSKKEFMYHSHVFFNKVLRSRLHTVMNDINLETMNIKEQFKNVADNYKMKLMGNGLDEFALKHLDALAHHLIDGKVHIKSQQINVQNILNNFMTIKSKRKLSNYFSKENLELAEKYVSAKSVEFLNEDEINAIYDLYSIQELNDEITQLSTLYDKEYNKIKFSNKSFDYNQLPFGYVDNNLNKAKYSIALVHESELSEFRDKDNMSKVLDSFTMLGEKVYRVKFIDDSVPYEDGILGAIKLKKNGSSIKSILKVIYTEKKRKKDKTVSNKDVDLFINEVMNQLQLDNVSDIIFKSDKTGIMPIYSSNGNIIDWIIPYSDDDLSKLEANMDIVDGLPHTITRLIDFKNTHKNNMDAVDVIQKFYRDKKNDDIDFIKISPTINKDLWNKLTPELKRYIQDMYNGVLYVPDAVLELILGARQASLANLRKNNILPYSDNTDFVVESYKLRKWIKLAEKVWGDILNKNKTASILFNPDISVGNFISNMMLMWTHGVPPHQYISEFYNKWKQLEEYEELNNKKIRLQIEKSFGKDVEIQLNRIKSQIKSHPFNDLVKDGQFAAMVDDLSDDPDGILDQIKEDFVEKTEDDRQWYSKIVLEAYRLKRKDPYYKDIDIEDIIEDVKDDYNANKRFVVPIEIEKARQVLYGSKGTKAHKFATKLTMYADTLARQMLYEKMKNDILKKNSGQFSNADKQRILNFVDKQFINYGYNVSGSQMWLEKVFGVQFLKYLFQHHKAYLKVIQKNPTGVLAQQTAQHATGINIADPMDTLADHTPLENILNRWKGGEPIEQMKELLDINMFMPLEIFDKDAWFKVYN